MKISCDEAAKICNKLQYNDNSFWEAIKLQFHVIYCKQCNEFTKKNTLLTKLCNKANLKALSDSEKEKMKQVLEGQF